MVPSRVSERVSFYKYLLFVFSTVAWSMGCTLIGVGLWLIIDRNYLTHIIGSSLFEVAAYILLVTGCIVFFISMLGCVGSMMENKCLIFSYSICLIVIALGFFLGGLLAGVFRTQIGNKVKSIMEDTLKNRYGVDLHEEFNRDVTRAWDKAQEKLRCCSVNSKSWFMYRESKWFASFGKKSIAEKEFSHEGQNPYVPSSCCVRDEYYRSVNEKVCMTWNIGPPGQQEGALNRALYYDGCYDRGKEFIQEHTSIMIGLGITFCIVIATGILLSCCLIKNLRRKHNMGKR